MSWMQAFQAAAGRLEKHGRRHAAQLKDRAALNRLAAKPDPWQEAFTLAQVTCCAPDAIDHITLL